MPFYYLSFILIVVFIPAVTANSGYDPAVGHDTVFKTLRMNEEELNHVSALQAIMDYNKLHDFVNTKYQTTPLTDEEREDVEKYLGNRPPSVVDTFLTDEDRKKLSEFHKSRLLDNIFAVVRQRLFELKPSDRRTAVNYMWPNADNFILQYFGVEK
ncbi:unnamed protein product [Auanema sp. JU1783]|nr:unnamed protein product [Auanema sp. JU1783]